MDDVLAQLAAVYQQVRQLQDQGQNEEGLSLALRLLEPSQRILGPQHPEVAEVHANIGILARRTGQSELNASGFKAKRLSVGSAPGCAV